MHDTASHGTEQDDAREQDAEWAGWRVGLLAYQPDVPLNLLPEQARERAQTFARRATPVGATPRLRTRLALAFGESYFDGALESALKWAWLHGDCALAADVRVCYLQGAW